MAEAHVQETLLTLYDSGANSAKFYRLRLFPDGNVEALWGRIPDGHSGELTGQRQVKPGGQDFFDRQKYAKERKGYTVANVVADVESVKPDSDLHATASASLAGGSTDGVVRTLVERLIAANKHDLMKSSGGLISVDTSGQARTALGIITAAAVDEARAILSEATAETDAERRGSLVEKYLRLVPQAVPRSAGRGWAPTWLTTYTTPAAQAQLLDALEASASYAAAAKKQAADAQRAKTGTTVDENFFRYRVTRLEPGTDEYEMVVGRFHETKQDAHAAAYRMSPKYVYRLEDRRHGSEIAKVAERIRNVQRLWHGTGAANVLSILQKGLFVPPTTGSGIHIAGRMFGDGVYLSRSATKSLNYSTSFWGGDTGSSPSTFMFLTLTAMGYEYRPTQRIAPPRGQVWTRPDADADGKRYDSTNVLPGTAGVVNHEAIVRDPMQVNLQWLVEF